MYKQVIKKYFLVLIIIIIATLLKVIVSAHNTDEFKSILDGYCYRLPKILDLQSQQYKNSPIANYFTLYSVFGSSLLFKINESTHSVKLLDAHFSGQIIKCTKNYIIYRDFSSSTVCIYNISSNKKIATSVVFDQTYSMRIIGEKIFYKNYVISLVDGSIIYTTDNCCSVISETADTYIILNSKDSKSILEVQPKDNKRAGFIVADGLDKEFYTQGNDIFIKKSNTILRYTYTTNSINIYCKKCYGSIQGMYNNSIVLLNNNSLVNSLTNTTIVSKVDTFVLDNNSVFYTLYNDPAVYEVKLLKIPSIDIYSTVRKDKWVYYEKQGSGIKSTIDLTRKYGNKETILLEDCTSFCVE